MLLFGSRKVFLFEFDRRSGLHVIEIDFEEKEEQLETTDILETVTGTPSMQKAIKEEENKLIEKEEKAETQTLQIQQVKQIVSSVRSINPFF